MSPNKLIIPAMIALSLAVGCQMDTQSPTDNKAAKISQINAQLTSDVHAYTLEEVNLGDIDFSRSFANPITSAEDVIQAVTNQLGVGRNIQFNNESTRTLPNGTSVTKFVQHIDGVPIMDSVVTISVSKSEGLRNVSGIAVIPQRLLETPMALIKGLGRNIAQELRARALADYFGPSVTSPASQIENFEVKQFYQKSDQTGLAGGSETLTPIYVVNFFDPDATNPRRPYFVYDGVTGDLIDKWEGLTFATATGPGGNQKTGVYNFGQGDFPAMNVRQSGGQCHMETSNVKTENLNHSQSGSGQPFSFNCSENTHKPINGAFSPLNDAHKFGEFVYEMYDDWFQTSPLKFQLHMRVHYSNSYENAFWNGRQMTFGDGRNRFYPLVSLDVSAHEVAHGFTEQNSGLVYRNESGGMNEAYSDMAGEAAEHFVKDKYGMYLGHAMPDFSTGYDIFKASNGALRYLCNPPQDGRSIGHVRDYRNGMDVHYSSGIFNKAFCLITKSNSGQWDVKKAFEIFTLANQQYWSRNSTFQSGAEGVLTATQDLGYSQAEVISAFGQVGITLGGTPAKKKYIYSQLTFTNQSQTGGCSVHDHNCLVKVCKSSLGNQAWKGTSGCQKSNRTFLCTFECSSKRDLH